MFERLKPSATPDRESGLSMVDLMMFMCIAGLMLGGVMFFVGNTVKGAQYQNIQAIATDIEQWSVTHPDKTLPVTQGFVTYSQLADSLKKDNSSVTFKYTEDTNNLVRVKPVDSTGSYIVCMQSPNKNSSPSYRAKASFYDMNKNELVSDGTERCS